MGDLLRRYWMPIAAVSEFEKISIKPVRLMGEDLVLYQGSRAARTAWSTATARIAAPTCRTASSKSAGCAATITAGSSTKTGAAASSRSKTSRIRKRSFQTRFASRPYPVEDAGRTGWAYLGPQPAPLLPNWEPFTWKNGFVQIVFAKIPCNWLQCQENSIDPVHFEWMHRNWTTRLKVKSGPTARSTSRSTSKSSTTGSPTTG